ncbi:MAG: DUF423 domain-containing protein [Flavobacteriia bacterium]|jgi:uncharacterized membrane protein YgdD (TMEM256/DUF423 family)
MNRKIVIVATSLLIMAIILGAFGAHGLKELVSPERLQTFEVGVKYQFYQGLGLLFLGLNSDKFTISMKAVWSLLILATLMFSVSIYFLAIQEVLGMNLKFLGPVTPIGGLLMVIGWSLFLWNIIRQKK